MTSVINLILAFVVIGTATCRVCRSPKLITRAMWGAEPATSATALVTPVPMVVVHHSSVPAACFNRTACSTAMRSMQKYHQLDNQWADIGYNFAVGSDGLVYEGRGWKRVGAHAAGVNSESIGIVLIGHWVSELPPMAQLQTTETLIAYGVCQGYIKGDYSLVGHRQVRDTECPGNSLFKEISSWNHFDEAIKL